MELPNLAQLSFSTLSIDAPKRKATVLPRRERSQRIREKEVEKRARIESMKLTQTQKVYLLNKMKRLTSEELGYTLMDMAEEIINNDDKYEEQDNKHGKTNPTLTYATDLLGKLKQKPYARGRPTREDMKEKMEKAGIDKQHYNKKTHRLEYAEWQYKDAWEDEPSRPLNIDFEKMPFQALYVLYQTIMQKYDHPGLDEQGYNDAIRSQQVKYQQTIDHAQDLAFNKHTFEVQIPEGPFREWYPFDTKLLTREDFETWPQDHEYPDMTVLYIMMRTLDDDYSKQVVRTFLKQLEICDETKKEDCMLTFQLKYDALTALDESKLWWLYELVKKLADQEESREQNESIADKFNTARSHNIDDEVRASKDRLLRIRNDLFLHREKIRDKLDAEAEKILDKLYPDLEGSDRDAKLEEIRVIVEHDWQKVRKQVNRNTNMEDSDDLRDWMESRQSEAGPSQSYELEPSQNQAVQPPRNSREAPDDWDHNLPWPYYSGSDSDSD